MKDIVGTVLIGIGILATVSGVVGVLRLPDFYLRLQASSKVVTLGVLAVLAGVVVAEGPITVFGSRALLMVVLVLVMSPLTAHALSRAAYRTGVPMWRGAVRDDVGATAGPDREPTEEQS